MKSPLPGVEYDRGNDGGKVADMTWVGASWAW